MRSRYLFALLFVLVAAPVQAAGINLSWSDCGTTGQPMESFACDGNTGSHRLFVSFVSPVPLTQLVGLDVAMDVAYASGTIPSWWMMQSSGACRTGALTGNTNFTDGPFACQDLWNDAAFGGVNAQPKPSSPNLLWLRGIAAVPSTSARTVDDATEYYAMEFRISNAKTVGAGACSGCDTPACIVLTSVNLAQPAGVGDYVLTQPISNAVVGWQAVSGGTSSSECFQSPLPVKRSTWGAVKGLYR